MDNQVARQKYEQLKMLDEQIQEFQKYIQELDQQIETLHEIIGWVDQLQDVAGESESFIPLANGIFVKGKITNTEEFFVNVGEKTIVKKTPEQTKQMLQTQAETLKKMREQAVQEFQKALEEAQKIEEEVQREMQQEENR